MAAEFFTRRGYAGAAVDEIGKGAGVTGPALYRHFPNKQMLLDAVLLEGMEAIVDATHTVVSEGGEPAAVLQKLIETRIDLALGPYGFLYPLNVREQRNTSEAARERIQALTEIYRFDWIRTLMQIRPEASSAELRTAFHAAHSLIGFTADRNHGITTEALRTHMIRMVSAVLMA